MTISSAIFDLISWFTGLSTENYLGIIAFLIVTLFVVILVRR